MSIPGMVSVFSRGLQTHSVLENAAPPNVVLTTVIEGVEGGTFDFLFM